MVESEAMLPDGFPAGLRVFVVDEDSVALRMLEKMLLQCGYEITISDCPLQALELLRANIGNYDIVLIDLNLTCMDGFELLGNVSREISLPVIMLSAYSDFQNVMKGIKYGAIDYLVKPVRLEELKVIWKHVVKKYLNEMKSINESSSMDVKISHLTKKSKNLVRKRDEDDDIALKDNLPSQKRARVSWTPELHAKFINAVNQLGIDKAVPTKILDIMGIPGLTRENVASHLQLNKNNRKVVPTQVHKSTRIQLMFKVIVWKIMGEAMLRIWQSYLSLAIWMTQMSFM
ncbi:hypothetical protein KFK09_011363 [Dendrobium nobile]|uniref:Uncharacterized protein n=1 Tax=Dendrobium nobile TaxID=94219 RepID=A0A8T3BEC3_DENNO|nr:hypothetical protein KFK09_011363 [Dendrobium nobile]